MEMKKWFADLTMNVLVRMVAGKRCFGVAADGDEEEGRRCQKALRNFFHYVGLFLPADAIPFLRWLDLGGHEKAMKETFKEMDGVISGWLEEHRRRREPGGGYKGDQDFMDIMLSTLEGTGLAGYDADTVNKATCLVRIMHCLFFLAYLFAHVSIYAKPLVLFAICTKFSKIFCGLLTRRINNFFAFTNFVLNFC